jgi:hypothetical protein
MVVRVTFKNRALVKFQNFSMILLTLLSDRNNMGSNFIAFVHNSKEEGQVNE